MNLNLKCQSRHEKVRFSSPSETASTCFTAPENHLDAKVEPGKIARVITCETFMMNF